MSPVEFHSKKTNFVHELWLIRKKDKHSMMEKSRLVLEYFYNDISRYPSGKYISILAKATSLSEIQVMNWFKNQRKKGF